MIEGKQCIDNKKAAKINMLITALEEDGRILAGTGGSIWPEEEHKIYWDVLSGRELDPVKIKMARKEEMKEFSKHGVYKKVPTT